jgi:hypothetical protein
MNWADAVQIVRFSISEFGLRVRYHPTLTIAQTIWHDLAEFAGRDSASMKSCVISGSQTLLVDVASC